MPVVAVGAVVVEHGRVLLVRRGRPPQQGRWSVPGGRVEWGELLAAAVEREVLEETGIRVRCGGFVGVAERLDDDQHFVILDFFATRLPRARREPRAHGDAAEARWVALERLSELPLVEGLYEFLAANGVISSNAS
jgi:8-oxo-dGTP diphosphatase